MIYDCFTFLQEFELLEIRLHELSPYVDKFVIIEADTSFTGNLKPLYFDENKNREEFKEFKDRIIHLVVRNMPREPWAAETFQRNSLTETLASANCEPDDVIFVGAVDEMPKGEKIPEEFKLLKNHLYFNMCMIHTWYYVNCLNESPMTITGTGVAKYEIIKNGMKPQQVRHGTDITINPKVVGWHFSWIGDADRLIQKTKSFSHTDFDKEPYTKKEYVEECLKDPEKFGCHLGRSQKLKIVPLDEISPPLPKYLLDNQDKFKNIIYKRGG